jgi:hypothetical protein
MIPGPPQYDGRAVLPVETGSAERNERSQKDRRLCANADTQLPGEWRLFRASFFSTFFVRFGHPTAVSRVTLFPIGESDFIHPAGVAFGEQEIV